jgi:hypothetical protein
VTVNWFKTDAEPLDCLQKWTWSKAVLVRIAMALVS